MSFRKALYTLSGVVLLGVLATSSIGAVPNVRRTTHFHFSKAVQLPGVALPAGTYVFEIVNPDASADLVRVSSNDGSTAHALQFTQTVHRPRTRDMKPSIVLGEQREGTPPTVKAWFPEDETLGRQFIY